MAVMKEGKGTENGEWGVLPQEASEKIVLEQRLGALRQQGLQRFRVGTTNAEALRRDPV